MGDFFAELRRRHIYRIGAGYVVVAWGITQVLDVLSQIWALPAWIAQPVTIVLALGLPITLIVAWLIEGKAHEAVASAVRSKATTVDWILIGAVALVLTAIGYQQLTPETVIVAAADEVVEDVQDVSDVLPNSVAILLFDNLSPNPDDAYFAAGVHESILNELVKIRDMNVIARTSVLRYADTDMSIPEIANELNVETVMEGSVRYAGDQVRVTAQLIDPNTGAHIWSEEYDRDLADIFAIQSDIAERIAMALEAELLPSEQESIERQPTQSPDAYTAFLKAMAVVRNGTSVGGAPGARLVIQNYLDEALRLDPEFALAHAWKASTYVSSRLYEPVREENWLDFKLEVEGLADAHLDMALALDPSLGFAHGVRGLLHFANWRGGPAQIEAQQALQLSPNDPTALILSGLIELHARGQNEVAIRYLERAVELDPNSAEGLVELGLALNYSGMLDRAIEVGRQCLVLDPREAICSLILSESEFILGDREAALDALRMAEQLMPDDAAPGPYGDIAWGYGLLGQPEDAQRAFEKVGELAADRYIIPSIWAAAYMGIGNYDEALTRLDIAAENPELFQQFGITHGIRANGWSDPMLEEPEWLEVREKLRPR